MTAAENASEDGCFVRSKPALSGADSGKRGGHRGQRAAGLSRLEQAASGAIPATCMKRTSWKLASRAGERERPMRGRWPLRAWSCLRDVHEEHVLAYLVGIDNRFPVLKAVCRASVNRCLNLVVLCAVSERQWRDGSEELQVVGQLARAVL